MKNLWLYMGRVLVGSVMYILGKLKFQITNQQIAIQTKFSGLKIEDIP
jgi:hypothetical protein